MESEQLVKEAERLVNRLYQAAAASRLEYQRFYRIEALIGLALARLERRRLTADAERERRGAFFVEKQIKYTEDGDVLFA